jgi:predicted  nucleic acid-binding Zn-ribbon protein
MRKEKIDTKVSKNHIIEQLDFKGKTNEELTEIAETLKAQIHQYHTLAIKAEGAYEVVLQMLPEKENSEG